MQLPLRTGRVDPQVCTWARARRKPSPSSGDQRPTKKRCQRQASIISLSSGSDESGSSQEIDTESTCSVEVAELVQDSRSAVDKNNNSNNNNNNDNNKTNHQAALMTSKVAPQVVDISVDPEITDTSEYESMADQDFVLAESQSFNSGAFVVSNDSSRPLRRATRRSRYHTFRQKCFLHRFCGLW